MTPPLWVGLVINLLVPFLGVVVFVFLCRRMRREAVPLPPYFAYFILFSVLGGWLVMILTALFWEWSGMASLGMLYLAGVGPLVAVVVALRMRKRRSLTPFHRVAYIASLAYGGVMLAVVALGTAYIGWKNA